MAQIQSHNTFTEVKDHIQKGRILSKGANLTIASGAITVTDSYHIIDGEGSTSDALTDINGGKQAGQLLVLQSADNSNNITVTHNTAKLCLNGAANFALNTNIDTLTLMYDGAKWVQIASSNNYDD